MINKIGKLLSTLTRKKEDIKFVKSVIRGYTMTN